MEARVYDRLAAILSIAFLLVLGAGTYYLAAWASRDTSPAIQTKTNEPDVFVEGVSLTRVGPDGEPVFQMSARSMRHFPFDGTSEFLLPRLISLDASKPAMSVTADRAIASSQGTETVLTGNVVLTRERGDNKDQLIVRTERLTMVAKSEIAKTDALVQIEQGNARLTGIGMEFDNLSRNLQLKSQVQAYWPKSTKP